MPLYTYVVNFDGESQVIQSQRSNFQGFADWFIELPKNLQDRLKREMSGKIYAGFEEVPNRKNVWRRSIPVGEKKMVVVVVETKS